MTIELRMAEPDDIHACSKIMYEAFKNIADQHNFPEDFPSPEVAGGLLNEMMSSPDFGAFVCEENNTIRGSIFVSQRSSVGGISVITVDPNTQNRAIGKSLMEHGMKFLEEQGHKRQQLIQAAYHNRSLCLYSKLGFTVSDVVSVMTGDPIKTEIPGKIVRLANESDLDGCNALCNSVLGFDRKGEVAQSITSGMALVVESEGIITGYTTGVGFAGHGIGKDNDDLKAMMVSVNEFTGPGIMIPTGNGELFRWCLGQGLKVVQQNILMDTSPTGSINGNYWPSILC